MAAAARAVAFGRKMIATKSSSLLRQQQRLWSSKMKYGGTKRCLTTAAAFRWPPDGIQGEFAIFAGGCFWGTELHFQRVEGVLATAVGYTAGHTKNPFYEEVCMGTSGHAEAINVIFDPSIVSYDELVDKHMATHDPTQKNRQGNDVGTQYRSGIYVYNDEQKKVAEAKCAAIKGCVTEILPATTFHPAEDYHQQYLSRGGRFGMAQSAAKGCTDTVRCYG